MTDSGKKFLGLGEEQVRDLIGLSHEEWSEIKDEGYYKDSLSEYNWERTR